MSEMPKIKDCPFCGLTATIFQPGSIPGTVELWCSNCGAQTSFHESRKDAIKAWNQRYEPALTASAEGDRINTNVAVAVLLAVRSLRQDVRPYMRHLDDCELVKFRESSDAPANVPHCTCGLEKVLWDLPEEIETGRTK